MRHISVGFLMLFALILLAVIIGLNLAVPPETHAHPQYGFTPQPPPPPPDGGGDDDDDGRGMPGDIPDDGDVPTDYVWVQLDHCGTTCYYNYENTNNDQTASALASIDNNAPLFPEPMNNNEEPVEVLIHVQMVHQGSGFMAEGTLSDAKSARFNVPYPGQWEVFLVAEPQFVTPETINTTNLNLEPLKTQLTNAPVSLGLVEANTPTTQWIKCPIECVVDLPPPTLPETGSADTQLSILILFAGGFLLGGLGMLIYRTHHS